jgi:hypothetical protein
MHDKKVEKQNFLTNIKERIFFLTKITFNNSELTLDKRTQREYDRPCILYILVI